MQSCLSNHVCLAPFPLDPPNSLYLQPHLAEELLKPFLLNLIALVQQQEPDFQVLTTTDAYLTTRLSLEALMLFHSLHTLT